MKSDPSDALHRKLAEVTLEQRHHRAALESIRSHARGWEETAAARAEGAHQVLRESTDRHPSVDVMHRHHLRERARLQNLIGTLGERLRVKGG